MFNVSVLRKINMYLRWWVFTEYYVDFRNYRIYNYY